jgi:tight adherence protein B
VRLVVAALTLGLDVGARVRPLEGVAATLRADVAAQHEVRAAAAQARAQASVMIGAPILFVVANATRDPAGFGATLTRPIGAACLFGAVVLDGAGAWWMVRLMRGAR